MSELVEAARRIRRDRPDRILIWRPASGDALTAADLGALADTAESALAAAGVSAGDIVVSVAGNTATAIAVLLACRKRSALLLPVDRGTAAAELADILVRFGARAAVAAQPPPIAIERTAPLPDGLRLFVFPESASRPVTGLENAAVLKLTSGSTGLPRATITSEANMLADMSAICGAMDIGPDDVQLAAIPISHAYGLGNLVVPLLLQGTAIVIRDGFVPHQFHRDGNDCGVTIFPGVPFMFDHLLDHLPAGAWPDTLTRLITAGAQIESGTVVRFHERFGLKIHSFYGTSETGGICFDDGEQVDAEPTVGRPMPNVTVTLRAEEGAPANGGRVHVAGPAVAAGYLDGGSGGGDEPVDSPFLDGGFLTGDIGRFDGRGCLELHGRVSSFVNVAGRKVQPREVEAVLRGAPGVADVRVLGAPDTRRGQQLVACVVPDRSAPSAAALRAHCAARLAAFKIPRLYLFLDAIPLTERGKTDRARLEQIVARHTADPG